VAPHRHKELCGELLLCTAELVPQLLVVKHST
jgi:hypothetical protein